MKQFWFCLYMVIMAYTSDSVFGQEQGKGKTMVLLDPGHGGIDTGAIGIHGTFEKDIVLKIAKEAVRLNRELYGDTLDIYLTRYSDTLISLGHRTKLAIGLQADLFISIHCNQAKRKAAQGIEVYIHQDNVLSLKLANWFANGLNKKLGFKNRGVKTANFQVLRETSGLCPGVLLELGFLSNGKEALHNSKGTGITAFALLILETLITCSND